MSVTCHPSFCLMNNELDIHECNVYECNVHECNVSSQLLSNE